MRTLLLDGHNLAFRSFYAMPEQLTRKDGFPTGALHGWLRTLWWLEDNAFDSSEGSDATRAFIFFDRGPPQRHLELQADYKANRDEAPVGLARQLPHMEQMGILLGWGAIYREGVEADDLIGVTARHCAAQGDEVRIVSADKDLGQLLDDDGRITQLLPPPTANPKLGWRQLDAKGLAEKFGVPPRQIPDYLALIGDTSDNVPGIQGVGPKTAAKWLQQYKGIEEILAHSGELKPVRFQKLLYENREQLRTNLRIVTLDADCAVPDLSEVPQPDYPRLLNLLEEMEMNRSIKDAKKRYEL